MSSFDEWFRRATGHEPYPFQVRFACESGLLSNVSSPGKGQGEGLLVHVRTGLGKTKTWWGQILNPFVFLKSLEAGEIVNRDGQKPFARTDSRRVESSEKSEGTDAKQKISSV